MLVTIVNVQLYSVNFDDSDDHSLHKNIDRILIGPAGLTNANPADKKKKTWLNTAQLSHIGLDISCIGSCGDIELPEIVAHNAKLPLFHHVTSTERNIRYELRY